MKTSIAVLLCACLFVPACAGNFDFVGRSTRISDGSRVAARNIIPTDQKYQNLVEHVALAEEIYSKQLDHLRERRVQLRSRHRSLTFATYATFAATTLAIGATAIAKDQSMMDNKNLAGYGALAGLGVGTGLEVGNLMQEDPANVEAKIARLQASYDTMVDRLRDLFESEGNDRGPDGKVIEADPHVLELKAGPIVEGFINEALQINIKG